MDLCPGIVTLWLGTSSCCGMALAADPWKDPRPEGWAAGVGPVVPPLQLLRVPHIHLRVSATVPQESSDVLAKVWPAERSAWITANVADSGHFQGLLLKFGENQCC